MVLKLRSPISLIIEVGLPTLFVAILIMIRGVIGEATTFPERMPLNGGVPILPYREFSNYTAFKLTNLNVHCAMKVDDSGGKKGREKFKQDPINHCNFLKFAVLPRDSSDPEQRAAVKSFLEYAERHVPALGSQGRNQLIEFDDPEALYDYIRDPMYPDTETGKHPLGVAITFNKGPPHWDYTIRVNRTWDSGGRPGVNLPSTKKTTKEIMRQSPLCYDYALGMAGGAIDLSQYQSMLGGGGEMDMMSPGALNNMSNAQRQQMTRQLQMNGNMNTNMNANMNMTQGQQPMSLQKLMGDLSEAVGEASSPGIQNNCAGQRGSAFLFQYWASGK